MIHSGSPVSRKMVQTRGTQIRVPFRTVSVERIVHERGSQLVRASSPRRAHTGRVSTTEESNGYGSGSAWPGLAIGNKENSRAVWAYRVAFKRAAHSFGAHPCVCTHRRRRGVRSTSDNLSTTRIAFFDRRSGEKARSRSIRDRVHERAKTDSRPTHRDNAVRFSSTIT